MSRNQLNRNLDVVVFKNLQNNNTYRQRQSLCKYISVCHFVTNKFHKYVILTKNKCACVWPIHNQLLSYHNYIDSVKK